ncbi:MAG: hypothetical protein K8S25_04595 [Alphaproteobacteria bacterium]|nr:hypothetical protein [Alphaproteobacteria bacterium]
MSLDFGSPFVFEHSKTTPQQNLNHARLVEITGQIVDKKIDPDFIADNAT